MNKNVINIPYGNHAVLRINRDKIVATVSEPGSDHIDIYTSETAHPWHVTNTSADALIHLIWEDNL